MRKRLLRGGAWALMARGLGIVGGLAVNALLARLLAPEDMGAYFLSVSVAAFLSALGQFGMPTAVVRMIAESIGKGQSGRAFKAIVHALVICSGSASLLAVLYLSGVGDWLAESLFHSELLSDVSLWIALLSCLFVFQGLFAEIFRGFHDIRLASLLGGVSTSLFSAMIFGVLWVVQGHAQLSQVLVLSAGAVALSVVISIALMLPRCRALQGDGTITVREMAGVGWPLCVTSVTVLVAVQGDLWVVGAMLDEKSVAIYGAALRLLAMMTMFHGLAISVIQSTVAELYGQKRMSDIQRMVQGAAFWACVIAGAVLLVFLLFGHTLLGVIFGEDYRQGYEPLAVLAFGQFVGMLLGPAGMVLMMTGHQQTMMWVIVLNSTIGIVLAVALAPVFGLMGIAVSWALTALMQGIAAWWLAYRATGVFCHVKYAWPYQSCRENA